MFAGVIALSTAVAAVPAPTTVSALPGRPSPAMQAAGSVLRVNVPDAFGGKTVIGQVTVQSPHSMGYVQAYGCDDGRPGAGEARSGALRSDLNYRGDAATTWSNRLVVEADDDGDICLYTLTSTELIVDVNAVSFDRGINSFPNRRTDTRTKDKPIRATGSVLKVNVPEAKGGKIVVGQLTVDEADGRGWLAAYGCANGRPGTGGSSGQLQSDLNFDGAVTSQWSNRLLVRADDKGDVCFYNSAPAEIIVDVNGVAEDGIEGFSNRRTDTRSTKPLAAGKTMKIHVPEAVDRRVVLGQLTAVNPKGDGHLVAYPCADGIPGVTNDADLRSDLNYDGAVANEWSNRLIVEADDDGDVCLYTYETTDIVVDINGVAIDGLLGFPNIRVDTRVPTDPKDHPLTGLVGTDVPEFVPLTTRGVHPDVAALTGRPASEAIRKRPIIAVKVDNYGQARPQWNLDRADTVFEVNVEGVTRFIALFHSDYPDIVGPIRSARTTDLELLGSLNRPIFSFSGANPGVNNWIDAAHEANWLVDYSGQQNPCYERRSDKPGPHNLVMDPTCAAAESTEAGPAAPIFTFDDDWSPGAKASNSGTFSVKMDGVTAGWQWDAASGRYLRSQNGQPHVTMAGTQVAADNVIVLEAPYVPSVVDERSPHALMTGSGTATVHRDGNAIAVRWSRPSLTDPFVFTAPTSGGFVPLDIGTTFVEVHRSS